jgi:hypothetical protein
MYGCCARSVTWRRNSPDHPPSRLAQALRNPVVVILYVIALLAGAVLTVAILRDALETIVFPRIAMPTARLKRFYYYRATWNRWASMAHSTPPDRRERFLSWYGPLAFIGLLLLWALGLITAFALMHWSQRAVVSDLPGDGQFFDDFYLSGTSLFTLGFGDVLPHNQVSRLLSVAEAGIGLMFLTAVLGYLPVLYGSFFRRETRLALLEGWAGCPPAAAEIFCRLARSGDLSPLPLFLEQWENWCGDVLQSHLSHPAVAYFRSQHQGQSWIEALVTVLDVSALVKVGIDGVPVWQAELTFAIAKRTAVDLTTVLGLQPDHSVDRLPADDMVALRRDLALAGVELNASPEASRQLVELRKMYEPYVVALSKYLLISVPPWRAAIRSR